MIEGLSIPEMMNISFIGLGLILALYTVISDRLNQLQGKRRSRHSSLKNKEDKAILKLVENKHDKDSKEELKTVWKKIEKIESGVGYHYNWGYFTSGIAFVVTLIGSFTISMLAPFLSERTIDMFFFYSKVILIVGMLNFFYVWFRIMFDMRALFRDKMEIIEGVEEEQKKEETKKEKKKPTKK